MIVSIVASAQQGSIVSMSPAIGATNVNPDTHLAITFFSSLTLGDKGTIRIYDVADNKLVDTLDMSIPAGPDFHRRRPAGSPPDTTTYQNYTVGGVEGFHVFPVIVAGRVATIYPHSQVLQYGRKYSVKIDDGVLNVMAGFSGFKSDSEWTFTTKKTPPKADATKLTVGADGSGDFNTVQGAIDFVPAKPAKRVTIFIKNGNYEELVFLRNKSNITIRGEDRNNVQVGYGNNSAFNPPEAGKPNRRPAFSIYSSTDIQLSNFTINNYFIGQAEALLVAGSQNIIDHMTLNGSGDALNIRGSVYMTDSKLVGHGDTILSVGPAFFIRTEIHSIGPINWIRNPATNHGHVFKECTFIGIDEPLPWTRTADGEGQKSKSVLARLPNNNGANYPYAEAVLINSKLKDVSSEGWGPVEESPAFDSSNVHFWEFNSMDIDGRPLDMSQRHPVAKQLRLPKDSKTIADYSNPEFVLGGWKPVVH
jgi:pectin methylesterase-like acyl-CoA thioesterase